MSNPHDLPAPRRPRGGVLIIESEAGNRAFLETLCRDMGLQYISANDPDAEAAPDQKMALVITELMEPEKTEYVRRIRERHPGALVLVQTNTRESETIIEVMRQGVYDYLLKPLNAELCRIRLENALEFKYLKDLEEEQKKNADVKLRSQIEWLNFREIRRKITEDKGTIYNLRTSLSQGGGLGNTVALLDMLRGTIKVVPEGYLADRDLVDLLFENNNMSRRMLAGLNDITLLMEKEFTFETESATDFVKQLPDITAALAPLFAAKNLIITYPEDVADREINIDREAIRLAIEELAVNAYKYSSSDSSINIAVHQEEGYFCLSIRNRVDRDEEGIPPASEKLVLEPFYRGRRVADETIADIEKFGLGLGLTMVDFVVRKHNGLFFIQNLKPPIDTGGGTFVLSGLFLPLKQS